MAAKTKQVVKRQTVGELREENEKLKDLLEKGCRCAMCKKVKDQETKFYYDTDPQMGGESFSRICRECAKAIACRRDANGEDHEPTRESCIVALSYLNKPFLETVWNASIQESENLVTGKIKSNVWTAYAKNIQMRNYVGLTFKDSDIFKTKIKYEDEITDEDRKREMPEDVRLSFETNKKTTLRFLGYDPFENEPIEEQPILYAKLVNYFDESVKDDGLKLEAVIEIVQSFKDIKTINDAISKYKKQLGDNPSVIATIKSLADTKQKMISSALALAKDNGISVNFNNSKSKGAGTLSGIIKELSEMDLEGSEINTFNAETNEAISSIMEKSFENQMKQINPDENDWEREIVHQAKLIHTLQKERDNAVEYCRLLRKENKDLKDFLQERGIIDDALQVIDE
jgi:hypothetical protein